MKQRIKRLFKGQTCMGCKTKHRLKWYADTGCCSAPCLRWAMVQLRKDF